MNLEPLIGWGMKTLAILDNPGVDVLRYGSTERLEEKLGWLRQFREQLKTWSEFEHTIDVSVDFVRTSGLSRGAAKTSASDCEEVACQVSETAGRRSDEFCRRSATPLRRGERTAWQ